MNSTPDTRYSLICKLQDPHDAEAWAEFASIYQPMILRLIRARGLQHADATDVTQDVLTRVAAAVAKFDCDQTSGTFRGWLYRITRNLVVDFLRRSAKEKLVQADVQLEGIVAGETDCEESALFHLEFQRQILWLSAREVRKQVQPATWQAFWQTEIQRRPVSEVAEELHFTTGAVYVARSRVLARLRKVSEQKLAESTGFVTND